MNKLKSILASFALAGTSIVFVSAAKAQVEGAPAQDLGGASIESGGDTGGMVEAPPAIEPLKSGCIDLSKKEAIEDPKNRLIGSAFVEQFHLNYPLKGPWDSKLELSMDGGGVVTQKGTTLHFSYKPCLGKDGIVKLRFSVEPQHFFKRSFGGEVMKVESDLEFFIPFSDKAPMRIRFGRSPHLKGDMLGFSKWVTTDPSAAAAKGKEKAVKKRKGRN